MALAVNRAVFKIIAIALSDNNGSGGQGGLVLSLCLRFGADCSVNSMYVKDAIAQS